MLLAWNNKWDPHQKGSGTGLWAPGRASRAEDGGSSLINADILAALPGYCCVPAPHPCLSSALFLVWSQYWGFFPRFCWVSFPPGVFRAAAQESKARDRSITNVSAQVDLNLNLNPWTVPGWAWHDLDRGEVKLRYLWPLSITVFGSCW